MSGETNRGTKRRSMDLASIIKFNAQRHVSSSTRPGVVRRKIHWIYQQRCHLAFRGCRFYNIVSDGVDHGRVVYSFCFWLNINMVRYNIIIIVHLNVQALACDLQRCLVYSFTWCSVIHGLVDIWCFGFCQLILTLDWNIIWFIDWFLTLRFEYQSLKQKTTCMIKRCTFWWHHTMAPYSIWFRIWFLFTSNHIVHNKI